MEKTHCIAAGNSGYIVYVEICQRGSAGFFRIKLHRIVHKTERKVAARPFAGSFGQRQHMTERRSGGEAAREEVRGLKSASEPYAQVLAERARSRFKATWTLSETGASGPTGNPYGDAAGHCCYAVAGPKALVSQTLETGQPDRLQNMLLFSRAALALLRGEVELHG